MLEFLTPVAPETIALVRERLNALWEGYSAEEILPRIDEALSACPPAERVIAEAVCTALVELLQATGE